MDENAGEWGKPGDFDDLQEEDVRACIRWLTYQASGSAFNLPIQMITFNMFLIPLDAEQSPRKEKLVALLRTMQKSGRVKFSKTGGWTL